MKITKKLLFLAVVSILSGCGGMMDQFSMARVWLQNVRFNVDDKLNNDAPVTVHVVIPYREDLLAVLLKMPASKYFQAYDQLKKDSADMLDVFSVEVVPGQRLKDLDIKPSKANGLGVLIFARYNTDGDHRMLLAEERHILLNLGPQDFTIENLDAAKK
ncbi:MAG TPA: hypothetical protein VI959_03245 [Alphaproteobacteria bacterium]|nr:hypothetical protein [Alphaproteobacteria bacterium]